MTRLWTLTNPSSRVVLLTSRTISWGEKVGREQLEGVKEDPVLKKFALMKNNSVRVGVVEHGFKQAKS